MPDEPSGALAVIVATITGCLIIAAAAFGAARWLG